MNWRHTMAVRGGVIFALTVAVGLQAMAADRIRTDKGTIEGTRTADSQIRVFKGIPFAAPPVGNLRWQAPQPVTKWKGVRQATEFGSRCMQGAIYSDMIFRDPGISEDCLYLNVWTPAKSAKAKLPVMVWIYGGGFAAGATSEARQDGENLARKGVVVVSMNYRLGVFGFFSHPELTKESGHHASGNYGLMDQMAALQWVKANIAAFGGNPNNVTIFGESAGSFSVSALLASPLAQGLFQKAIGESGAFFSSTALPARSLEDAEKSGSSFAQSIEAPSLAALRSKPATDLLQASTKEHGLNFFPCIDGYFLPESVSSIYAAGKQSHIPLLAGWNADEGSYQGIFKRKEPTAENFIAFAHQKYGDQADAFLKLYPATTDEQAKRSASDLAGDQFIAFSTWKWLEAQNKTGQSPVYRYHFEQAPPQPPDANGNPTPSRGAYHSADIEFVFGALASKKLPWRDEDRKLSDLMGSYWSNFAKSGDPNGPGLPEWPVYKEQDGYVVMHLNANPHATPDDRRARYLFLETQSGRP